jgi:hypothetical protein
LHSIIPLNYRMNFKIGEFVRFVEERREGYITRIIDDQTIAVTDEDGFEIPVLTNQITRVHGHSEIVEPDAPEIPQPEGSFKESGIYLAAVPDKRINSVVHLHIVNLSSYQLLLSFKTQKQLLFKGEFSGIIQARSAEKIYSASLNELGQWPQFHIQILRHSLTGKELKEPLIFSEKFKAKDFSSSKRSIEYIDQPAWLFQIDYEELVIDPQLLKESFHKPAEEKAEIAHPGREIDLHIEKLCDDHQFLSPSDLLNIQLNYFNKSIDAAIVHKLPSLIFIHGVGNGTLRHEIHRALSKHPRVRTFMDAYKEKFGYGATEVIFR